MKIITCCNIPKKNCKQVVNNYVIIAIVVGVFVAGFGISYAIMSSSSSASIQVDQIMRNPQQMQQMHNAMMEDRQHMNQMMGPMMQTMMGDSQMREQMMNMMLQHREMMSSMRQHEPMMNMMMMEGNMSGMMGSPMMGQGMKGDNMMAWDTTGNSQPMMKQQSRNQVGMMLQDPELKQQIRDFVLQNTNTVEMGAEILATEQSSDGAISVEIKSSTPMPGKFLEIVETFHDKNGNILEHVNHGIHVTQDGQTVLKMSELHSHHGEITYYTRELHSDSPVEVEILMHGIGMEEPLTGPIDEVITVEVS